MRKFFVFALCVLVPIGAVWGATRDTAKSFGSFTSSGPTIIWQKTGSANKLILQGILTDGADTVFVRLFGKANPQDTGGHIDADNDTVKFYAADGDSAFFIVLDSVPEHVGVKIDSLPRGTVTFDYIIEKE